MDDVSLTYDLKANSYMVKPADLNQLIRVAMCLDNVGIGLVAAPAGKKKLGRAGTGRQAHG